MLLPPVHKSPLRAGRDADMTELLKLRTKPIMAGDLNANHPIWNSKVSNPSGLKLRDSFVKCNFEISMPEHTTHFDSDGRGDVLDIVGHKGVRFSEVRVLDVMGSDHLPIMFCILDHAEALKILNPIEKFRDWERFQSLASAFVSPRIEIN
jgi:endonuclease/exonuclease/phosphatase (EEP) superfamily protein YafD